MNVLLATRNKHKVVEIKAILDIVGLELLTADDVANLSEVEEDGDTFESNACKKAIAYAAASGMWAMADDSGLEVDALDGAPGVYSARYAGEQGNDQANNAKLLRELDQVTDRRARFRCAIALADPDGHARTVDGRCEGRIGTVPHGQNGFGYDPLFVPDGYEQTFAELDEATKNRISHRAVALKKAHQAWEKLLSS